MAWVSGLRSVGGSSSRITGKLTVSNAGGGGVDARRIVAGSHSVSCSIMTAKLSLLPPAMPENASRTLLQPGTSRLWMTKNPCAGVCPSAPRIFVPGPNLWIGERIPRFPAHQRAGLSDRRCPHGRHDGFDSCAVVTGMGLRIPAIVVTARDDPTCGTTCELCGAAALLIKPVGVDLLLRAIEIAISKSTGRDARGQ